MLIGFIFGDKRILALKPHVGLVQLKGMIGEGEDIAAQPVIAVMTKVMKSAISSGLN